MLLHIREQGGVQKKSRKHRNPVTTDKENRLISRFQNSKLSLTDSILETSALQLNPRFTIKSVKHGAKNVLVWASFFGTVYSTFPQYNDTQHTPTTSKLGINDHQMDVLGWLTHSSGLNQIEHL